MTMKLLKLHIENFRSLRNVTWEPGDLNVLIGPNAGGKSNLLKAIELLAAAAAGELSDYVTRQGGIGALTWNGTSETIGFESQICESETSGTESGDRRSTYDIALKRTEKSSTYAVIDESLSAPAHGNESPTEFLFVRNRRSGEFDVGQKQYSFGPADIKSDESLLSIAAHPMLGAPLVSQFERYLADLKSHQAFRTDREASVRWAETSRRDTVVRASGGNLVSVLHTLYSDNSAFESDIHDAMFAAFGDEFVKLVFSPDAADQRIQFKVRWKSLDNPVPASEVSDGTLRYLYLLAILANPNPPPLIAIDEPETGLHPRMLSYVAEFAAEAARRTQVVFTTHSAEFLDAITPFNPTITVVEAQNAETHIQNVAKDTLDHWLKGYTLGELFRSNGLETIT
jgi:predicted ATPase